MSVYLSVNGYMGKNNSEFKKHYNAVKFCIENELSFPKETSEFFKGKVGGEDLEDYHYGNLLSYIKNGVKIDLKFEEEEDYRVIINVRDIPSECDQIVIEIL